MHFDRWARLRPLHLPVFFFLLATSSCAQQPRPTFTIDGLLLKLPEGSPYIDFLAAPGDIIYQNSTILLERIRLSHQVQVQVDEGTLVRRNDAWRLTVIQEPGFFFVGAQGWVICIDDTLLPAVERWDRITGTTFNDEALASGPTIGFSYGPHTGLCQPVGALPPLE